MWGYNSDFTGAVNDAPPGENDKEDESMEYGECHDAPAADARSASARPRLQNQARVP